MASVQLEWIAAARVFEARCGGMSVTAPSAAEALEQLRAALVAREERKVAAKVGGD
jgi:hypothetical protein